MLKNKLFYVICCLYTTIDGFISFILPRKLVSISEKYLSLMSTRYLTGFLTDLLIFKNFASKCFKYLISLSFFLLLIALIFLLSNSISFLLLSLILLGLVDVIFWSSSIGYLERVSDNFAKDLSLFSFFTLFGYFLSIVYLFIYLFTKQIIFIFLFVICNILIILSGKIKKDKIIKSTKYILKKENWKIYILIFLSSFLFFCWLSSYFIILPAILKIIGISYIYSILIFSCFNLSRAISGLYYYKILVHVPKKFRTPAILSLFMIFVGICTFLSLEIKNILFILISSILSAYIFMTTYNEWLNDLNNKFPEFCKSGEIGVFITFGSESAFCFTPFISSIISNLATIQFILYPILLFIILIILNKLAQVRI